VKDGLYQVKTSYLCAGFVIRDGKLVNCAPILRKRFEHWKKVSTLVTTTALSTTYEGEKVENLVDGAGRIDENDHMLNIRNNGAAAKSQSPEYVVVLKADRLRPEGLAVIHPRRNPVRVNSVAEASKWPNREAAQSWVDEHYGSKAFVRRVQLRALIEHLQHIERTTASGSCDTKVVTINKS